MVTGASFSVSYNSIASFNKKNENDLAASLVRLASGKRVQKPSDSIPDYFVAQNLKKNNTIHEQIRTDLSVTSGKVDVAEQSGTFVFEDLQNAMRLVDKYYDSSTPAEEKESMKTEFSMILSQISSTIDNTFYDGEKVIRDTGASHFAKVAIDSSDLDESLTLSFTSNQVADVSTLGLGNSDYATESQAVQNELNKAASYLSEVSVYRRGLNAFYNINETKITATQKTLSDTTDLNTGEEMMRAMNKSIRHQSSLAMMAQANMSRASVLRLFE